MDPMASMMNLLDDIRIINDCHHLRVETDIPFCGGFGGDFFFKLSIISNA
jgi:hypothetical protein